MPVAVLAKLVPALPSIAGHELPAPAPRALRTHARATHALVYGNLIHSMDRVVSADHDPGIVQSV